MTTTDSNGASVPGHDISAFIDPVTALTMSQIPAANLGVNQYSDSSHGGNLIDTNMAQRIDFINHTFEPMIECAPTWVSPPRMVACA